MSINLTANVAGLDQVAKQLPKVKQAIADAGYFAAINAGEQARDAVRVQMRQKLDRPTPFILRSLRITSASGGKIGRKATDKGIKLGFVDIYASLRHDPVTDTILPQVEGGPRQPKPAELRLRRAGILGANEYLVPSKTAPLNRYGNVSPGEYVRMLSDLRSFNQAGFTANSRYKVGRGHYFLAEGGGFRGIFKSTGGYGREALRDARLVWIVTSGAPRYSKHLPFYETAERVFVRAYPAELKKTMNKQLAKVAGFN